VRQAESGLGFLLEIQVECRRFVVVTPELLFIMVDIDGTLLEFREGSRGRSRLDASVHSYAPLPIGYPMGRFGPVRRVALGRCRL